MAKRLGSSLRSRTKRVARAVLPKPAFEVAKRLKRGDDYVPSVGAVRFGDLRRLAPISRSYGYDRGRPIDRYYIETWLESERRHITGRVLEVGERIYTERFGTAVTQSDMLHVMEGIPGTTFVDDLADGSSLPGQAFDCVIITQTLHLIYDMKAALATIARILKPGGVMLCTVPGITQVADDDWNDTWYWALTRSSARRLASEVFPEPYVEARAFGNVLSATAFLQGIAENELTMAELDHEDVEYPVTVTIKARTGDRALVMPMRDRWDYAGKATFAYDDETSYATGMAFLDGHGDIEDWGCGTAFARRFATRSGYRGIDGTQSPHADVHADLQTYRSETDCLFMRHVLEHNFGWRAILANALASVRKRMVLVVFTPFSDGQVMLDRADGIPDFALDKRELLSFLDGFTVREERIESRTQYGEETLFFIERTGDAPSPTR